MCPFSVNDEVLYLFEDTPISTIITELTYNIDGTIETHLYPQMDEDVEDPYPLNKTNCTHARLLNPNKIVPINQLRHIESLSKEEFEETGFNIFNQNILSKYFAKYYTLIELIDLNGISDHIDGALALYPYDFYNQPLVDANIGLQIFRGIFPLAIGINLEGYNPTDHDFIAQILPRNVIVPQRKLKINISGSTLSDAAFAPLNNWIHTLKMQRCNQITDGAFVHLRGIHILDMTDCNQMGITDAAFIPLRQISNLRTLIMRNCNQVGITGIELCNLNKLRLLNANGCNLITLNRINNDFGVTQINPWVRRFRQCP